MATADSKPNQAASSPLPEGRAGKDGATGPPGPRGATGATGATGPAGPAMARAEILAVVEDQFFDVRQRLDIQLKRTAEIQAQLDAQNREVVALRQQVDLVHGLLKKIIAKEP